MTTAITPRIVQKLLEAAHKLSSVNLDKECLCYLVSDEEWLQIIAYSDRFMRREDAPIGVNTMHFCGIEVIKRSALRRG
jgi:hypothetical protein